MSKDVSDSVAEKLEAAGLWRRAVARWLVVMDRFEYTDTQREWIRQRRQYCQSRITPAVIEPEKLDIVAINRAASVTQERMGLSRANGSMFRAFPLQESKEKNK